MNKSFHQKLSNNNILFLLYLLDIFINSKYVIVTIVRWSSMCLNNYPLGLGSLNPSPLACLYYKQIKTAIIIVKKCNSYQSCWRNNWELQPQPIVS